MCMCVYVCVTFILQETFEHRQRIVAVHEAGHALIAALLPDFDQVSV